MKTRNLDLQASLQKNLQTDVQNLIFQISRLDDILKNASNFLASPAAQTGARWQVLSSVENQARTVAEIARFKNVARQSVQRLADVLTKEGLTKFVNNPAHQRFPLLKLTPKGEKALLQIQSEREVWLQEISDQVSAHELRRVRSFLENFEESIRHSLPVGSIK